MKQNAALIAGYRLTLVLILFVAAASYGQPLVAIPDGYATQNGGTTGGGSAVPVTVSTASAFLSAVGNNNPAVIVVEGRLEVGNVDIGSNKTIIGADTSSGLYGGVIRVQGTNCIFQNLTIGPASGDTFEVSGATNVFIHKCEFFDSTDELCSIVRQADYVTVSWCKFYFNNPNSHSYAHLIGNGDDVTADRGKLHVTLHHNWYAEGVRGRMPRVRFGYVHIYNNYYNSPSNGYCIGIGFECHIRVEHSHFDSINNPWADYGGVTNGGFGWADLKFEGCSQPTFVPNTFPVFTPPYAYSMDPVNNVKGLLTDPLYGAGNCLIAFVDDTEPPAPDPMTWAQVPQSAGGPNIAMTAATVSDVSGAEYYFANVTDPTHDSGWQAGQTYVDSGLNAGTTYTYQVKARDLSSNANETAWSIEASAITDAWVCTASIAVDLSGDCRVNLDDFAILAAHWMELSAGEADITDATVISPRNITVRVGDGSADWYRETDYTTQPTYWRDRPGYAFVEGVFDDCFMAQTGYDPEVRSTIVGLVPGLQYNVWVLFSVSIDPAAGVPKKNNDIMAAFGSDALARFGWDHSNTTNTGWVSRDETTTVWTVLASNLGSAVADSSGTVTLRVDMADADGTLPVSDRTLWHAIAYSAAEPMDMAEFAAQWLVCNRDPNSECWR
ncbi:MAG: hypothetical protein LLF76_07445 [Planctomycetaceae bacterium]|nr:hypothetical protein [Planctomycetaceae bacterium]